MLVSLNDQISVIVTAFDLFGTFAFAISGALLGKQKEYNFWGVLSLAFCTAVGGGTIRNILVNLMPAVFEPEGWMYILCVAAGAVLVYYGSDFLVFKTSAMRVSANRLLARADAIGLAVFVMMGATIAIRIGLPFFGVIAFSVLSGAGGGVIRDVISGVKPYAFQGVHYVTWCVLGGAVAALMQFERPLIEPYTGAVIFKALFALVPAILIIVLRFREINREFPLTAAAS